MGNSSSSAAGSSNNRSNHPQSLNAGGSVERTPSISPGPGHSGLGSKKRSLELPDLAFAQSPYGAVSSQMRGRSNGPPDPPVKSAAIAIPVSPPSPFSHYQDANGVVPRPRATVILPSQTDLRRAQTQQREPSLEPAPALTDETLRRHQLRMERKDRERAARQRREAKEEEERLAYQQSQRSQPRGRQQAPPQAQTARQQQHIQRIQEAFDGSIEPPKTHAAPKRYNKEVVRSSIPTILKAKEKEIPPVPEEVAPPVQLPIVYEPVPVKIVWKGGGNEVILARAGDDEWKGRQIMVKE